MESKYLELFLWSMAPITELRLSIPMGILDGNLYWFYVTIVCILGNFYICIPIVYLLPDIESLFRKNRYTSSILDKIFKRTRGKSKLINKYKYYGIMLFVAIPFPLTGAWTGCLASYLFGFSRKKTLIAVAAGLFISATLVNLIVRFAEHLLVYIGYG